MQRFQLLTENDITKIHENSLRILEEIGVIFNHEPALEVFKKHGAKVEGKTVFIPKEMVAKALETTPSSFTLYSRNPERNVEFDTVKPHFCGPGGSAYIRDLDNGRRRSTKADFINLIKLFQSLDLIEMHHVPCEMGDVDPDIRNKEVVYQAMKYSDKPIMPFMYDYKEAKTIIEMASLPFGGLESIKNKPVILADPCTVTPLSYDDKAINALMAFAEYGQIQLINSLCMAGATAPATLAGNVSVQNAEILAGIVLTQAINPGCPIIYSASGSNADMRTGNLTVGSPEDALMSLINGQLAKFYNLPCRISGAINDSKCVDAQAAYESAINMMTTIMAGSNFILHGAGILETYNTISLEKVITDYEVLGMISRLERGIEVNEDTLAFDVIKSVGPQGQYLTEAHTFMNFRKEHYMPFLSNRQTIAQWEDAGSNGIEVAANAKWKQILEEYTAPDFSAELDADLQKFLVK